MKLLLGNEAVARGLYEAGCRVISSYPGTPSTEVTEYAAKYDEMYSEWAPNEKVAAEVAFGACVAGARSFCAMKHVGLNVAADPLFTASYTGVNAGMVLLVADDPGMHSSQNEQDSRHYAMGSKIMMLEPSDSRECLEFTKRAFDLSERFDTPVIMRLTTRVAHSRSVAPLSDRVDNGLKEYVKNPQKYVMVPANARGRHVAVEQRILDQTAFCEKEAVDMGINKVEYNSKKIGVIAAGICYQYAKEALGENASYLKLGCVYPLPVDLISILDGHIMLDRKLGHKNHYPAIDVLQSISRVMSGIATMEHKALAGKLKNVLATYSEAEDLINIGAYKSGSNPDIDYAIKKIRAVNEFLCQATDEKFLFEEEIQLLEQLFED